MSDNQLEQSDRRPRPLVRLIGLLMIIISVALATYLVVAYFAFETGKAEAVQQAATTRAEAINRQLELAEQELADSNYNIALRRLEYVIAEDADNGRAQTLRQQALAMKEASEFPQPTLEPQAPPAGEEELNDQPAVEPLPELQTIRRLATGEQWAEALPLLIAFQRQHPDYQRPQTDQLLYDTYVNLGLDYINTEKVELALNYFAQAEKLGNLPQEVLDYRLWADLYLNGIAYTGVNFDIAAGYFRDLCAAAPFYQSSCNRLYEALIGYGDQLAYSQDWCPAESVYREAWGQRATDGLNAKLAQAQEGCAGATPVPLTGTLPITPTNPLSGTLPITPTEPGG